MATNKKAPKSTDQKPDEDVIEGQEAVESTEAESDGNETADETADANEAAGEEDEPALSGEEGVDTLATSPEPASLHSLLAKAARHATSTHAGQESVFALHQLEMLTGRMKMLIPSAIAATDDADLQPALNTLLALL